MFSTTEVRYIRAAIQRNQRYHDDFWRLRHLPKGGWAVLVPRTAGKLEVLGTLSEIPTHADAYSVILVAVRMENLSKIPLEKIQHLAEILEAFIEAVEDQVRYHSKPANGKMGPM